ncbi:MAG: hypothetical protein ACE5PT_09925 [Gemmatimonadales bacterium]
MLRSLCAACALVLVAGAPSAHGQTNAIVLFGQGGRTVNLVDLSAGGDDFAPDFTLGGGLALQVGPSTALRASFARITTTYRGTALSFGDKGFTRDYIGGSLQYGWPGTSDLIPYILLGGGVIGTEPRQTGQATVRPAAGHLGMGVNYLGGLGGLGVVFAEATAWAYRFKGYGLRRVQVDVLIHMGVAVAIPF